MTPARRYAAFSVASALVWSGVAWLLAARYFGPAFWGGVIMSPLIGLAIGSATRSWGRRSGVAKIGITLISLYVAVTLFDIGIGVLDALLTRGQPRIAWAVIVEAPIALLWGVTFTGYLVLLLPLAYANLRLLAPLEPENGGKARTAYQKSEA